MTRPRVPPLVFLDKERDENDLREALLKEVPFQRRAVTPLLAEMLNEARWHTLVERGPNVMFCLFLCPGCDEQLPRERKGERSEDLAKQWGVLTWRFRRKRLTGVVHVCSDCARRLYDILLGRKIEYESSETSRRRR
jgi:hypothetical protein